MSDLSRRSFVAGTALAGAAVAGMATVAVADEAAPTAVAVGSGSGDAEAIKGAPSPADEVKWSWLEYPGDIEPDAEEDTEVVVVGCGFAGSVAAVSAAEKGAKVVVVDKASGPSGRGAHITAFGSKVVKQMLDEGYITEDQMDYAQIVRNWIRWSQGRLNESMLWMFAHKSGACMDWLCDKMEGEGLHSTLWCDFFKGPDYTEWPITHFFYDDTTDFVYLNGVSHGLGMDVLLPALRSYGESLGVEYRFDTACERLVRDGDGPVTAVIVTADDGATHTKINAANGVILASGDYSGDTEMMQRYNPWALNAMDERLYIPMWVNTGDLHKQAMWIGGAMQPSEPHCATIHLESGAQSYNFLHVNKNGERFMNEDVNTQSKSCVKSYQPEGKAFTIYDANSLESFAQSCNDGISGGISSDQQYRRFGVPFDMDVELKLRQAKIDQGLLFQADTLDELAEKAGIDAEGLKATVARYNELAAKGNDDDFGKRPEILWPIDTPPYFAGQLVSTLLAASGGLRQDTECHVLDEENNPIEGLYVCGAAGGEYFSNDYPTICPGTNHGRCLTFGRIAGINAAGGDADKEIADLEIVSGMMPEEDRVNTVTASAK